MKRIVRAVAMIGVLGLTVPLSAGAQSPNCDPGTVYSCFLLRVPYGLQQGIAQRNGLTILGEVTPGKPGLVLATGPSTLLPEVALANMQADPDVLNVELNTLEAVAEIDAKGGNGGGGASAEPQPLINAGNTAHLQDLTQSGIDGSAAEGPYFSGDLWKGYTNQHSLNRTSVHALHDQVTAPEAMGSRVVAIIDTGVDPNHPLLQGALLPGYDFILDQPGASEWNALADPAAAESNLTAVGDQSFSSIVDGAGVTDDTYPALQPIVDQSFSSIVDGNSLPIAFGHGTMVAGIIRIVAPAAQILPIRVFDGEGVGDMARIVRAIDWAVANGADVINMSFSTERSSKELSRAIKAARRAGAVLVSSAGNLGNEQLTYPAAYGEVLGVASTTKTDGLSTFSSYGLDLVQLGAPGEEIITLYPGGLYAGAWGSSFSTAYVSGSVATLHGGSQAVTPSEADVVYLDHSDSNVPANANGEIGAGRLDAFKAFACGPNAPAGACEQL